MEVEIIQHKKSSGTELQPTEMLVCHIFYWFIENKKGIKLSGGKVEMVKYNL